MRRCSLLLLLCVLLACAPGCGGDEKAPGDGGTAPAAGGDAPGAQADTGLGEALRARIDAAAAKGRAYLLTQQGEKGGFGDNEIQLPANVAYTALAVPALVATSEDAAADEAVTKALAFLAGFQQENGSIVDNPQITNYATAASISAFAAAKRAQHASVQAKAAAYLEASQIATDPSDPSYGGFPYKQHLGQSADASNAVIATNALDANGLPADSEVRKRVGAYVSRVINNTEANTGEVEVEVDGEKRIVVSGVDMGAFYRPGESKAGMIKRSDGKWELRSYGSMTYAALKLMMFAGLPAEDPRVQGVVRWISRHWTVERNPGFEHSDNPEKDGQQGMFYYLYTATRALDAYERATGKPLVVTDADGRRHNWRAEIALALLGRQAEDGSWRNEVADRWEEGSKTLATAFALQTFGYLTGRLK